MENDSIKHDDGYQNVHRVDWRSPVLTIHGIQQLTKLGLTTNCDGGFGLNAIDGNAVGCGGG